MISAKEAAQWVAVVGALAGLGGVQWSTGQRAAERQKQMDILYQRIGNDEATIAAIRTQMPKDTQAILDAVTGAQNRAQDIQLRQPVMYEKKMPSVGQGVQSPPMMYSEPIRKAMEMPSADAPAVEKPQ